MKIVQVNENKVVTCWAKASWPNAQLAGDQDIIILSTINLMSSL